MTQSLNMIYFSGWLPTLITLSVCVLIAFLLAFITSRYSKDLKKWECENKKVKEYKPTKKEKLISILFGVIILCLIIFIVVYIFRVIGNQLNEASIICANCTTALS
jgi:archaellum biogenesis protein FlaJ (TadC family)